MTTTSSYTPRIGKLRGMLIGCGFFAENHLNAWTSMRDTPLEGVELVAVCDRDLAKAEAAARRFGIPRAYADAETMLAKQKPDFVDIATTFRPTAPWWNWRRAMVCPRSARSPSRPAWRMRRRWSGPAPMRECSLWSTRISAGSIRCWR